jgi:helicase MOV-10
MGAGGWTEHITTGRHQKKLGTAQLGQGSVEPEEGASTTRSEYCGLCGTHVPRTMWSRHAQGPTHKKKERFTAYKATLEEAEKNKHGVIVSDDLELGIVSPADARHGVGVRFTIETTVPASRIRVVEAKLSSTIGTKMSSA